jgi:hypothetical protein
MVICTRGGGFSIALISIISCLLSAFKLSNAAVRAGRASFRSALASVAKRPVSIAKALTSASSSTICALTFSASVWSRVTASNKIVAACTRKGASVFSKPKQYQFTRRDFLPLSAALGSFPNLTCACLQCCVQLFTEGSAQSCTKTTAVAAQGTSVVSEQLCYTLIDNADLETNFAAHAKDPSYIAG